MEAVGHIGVPIYKGEDRDCPWVHIQNRKVAESFPVCRNPEAIQELFPAHLFILRCGAYGECSFFLRQRERNAHRELIGKYLDKYSLDGFVLIPDKHFIKLMEKMGTQDDGARYITVLLMSYGWYKIDKPAEMDEGTLFTNKQNKELMSSRRELSAEAV